MTWTRSFASSRLEYSMWVKEPGGLEDLPYPIFFQLFDDEREGDVPLRSAQITVNLSDRGSATLFHILPISPFPFPSCRHFEDSDKNEKTGVSI